MAELGKGRGSAAKSDGGQEGKYLTFSLDREEYGIGILKVKEIIGILPITPVPRTPGYMKGVINLRGKVIPVVDLRLKFGMEQIGHTERTCIIVVEASQPSGAVLTGIMVDSVSEVLNVKAGDIEDAPDFGVRLDTGYILGLAKMNGGVKILLHIDKVLENGERSFKPTSPPQGRSLEAIVGDESGGSGSTGPGPEERKTLRHQPFIPL